MGEREIGAIFILSLYAVPVLVLIVDCVVKALKQRPVQEQDDANDLD